MQDGAFERVESKIAAKDPGVTQIYDRCQAFSIMTCDLMLREQSTESAPPLIRRLPTNRLGHGASVIRA